jgi:hypothetical protein
MDEIEETPFESIREMRKNLELGLIKGIVAAHQLGYSYNEWLQIMGMKIGNDYEKNVRELFGYFPGNDFDDCPSGGINDSIDSEST